jgi:predicted nucleic acid-binding protein
MPQIVVDSSTLILLAKCSLLRIVCDLFEVVVPEAVSIEVASEDLLKNYPDAALISELTSKGAIEVQSLDSSDRPTLPLSLHKGEEDALLLALKLGKLLFATDDGKAIKAARFFKVPFIVTPKVIVELFRLRKISFKKARESLEKLGKIGRYSPEIIADALVSLMEAKNGKADNHKDTRRLIE